MSCQEKFISSLFSVKRKENDLDRKYIILEGNTENASSSLISQIKQNILFYFI